MPLKKFKKIVSDPTSPNSREFNETQNHMEEVLTPLTNSIIIDGVYLKEIDLTVSVDNLVEHKLGRKPLGWIVVRKFADANIWESLTVGTVNYDRTKFINFQTDTTTSDVYFWIF